MVKRYVCIPARTDVRMWVFIDKDVIFINDASKDGNIQIIKDRTSYERHVAAERSEDPEP